MDTPVYVYVYMYTHTHIPTCVCGWVVGCMNIAMTGTGSTQKPIATLLIAVILLRHLNISVIQVKITQTLKHVQACLI